MSTKKSAIPGQTKHRNEEARPSHSYRDFDSMNAAAAMATRDLEVQAEMAEERAKTKHAREIVDRNNIGASVEKS